MIILGITGGMGCGKSAAGACFADLGWGRSDSDQIVRELLTDDVAVIEKVTAAFGPAILDTEGGIDRKSLAGVVFAEPASLQTLEGILHPRVREIWKGRVEHQPQLNWVVEIPLLFEKGLEKEVDFTVCIASDPLVQAQRLASRGLSQKEVSRRIARQLPLAQKIDRADFVITNNGSLGFLSDQVFRLARDLSRVDD
jgi:dephospho-CoA kinase